MRCGIEDLADLQSTALRVYNAQQSYLSEVDYVFPAGSSQELVFKNVSGQQVSAAGFLCLMST